MATTEAPKEESEELLALREVHSTLIEAVRAAQQAVAVQVAQRRFWLEEIAGNLNEEGKLVTTSVWKRPIGAKAVRKPSVSRRKKKEPSPDKQPPKKRKKQNEEEGGPQSMRLTVHGRSSDGEEEDPHPAHREYMHPAYPPQASQWAGHRAPNLQMMAAVAFGANPASYPYQQYGHYYPPPAHQPPQQAPPRGSRTYSSIQDVSDEESDHDAF